MDIAVLTGDKARRSFDEQKCPALVKLFLDGDFEAALKSAEGKQILGENSNKEEILEACVLKNVEQYLSPSDPTKELAVLVVGAACLQLFVQNNWTGPQTSSSPASFLPASFTDDKMVQENALSYLSEDWEPVYTLSHFAGFLHAARAVLMGCRHLCTSQETWDWWLVRCLIVQQTLLEQRSPTLKTTIFDSLEQISQKKSLFDEDNRDIAVLFHIEASQLCQMYWEVNKAKKHVQEAQRLSSITLNQTAALGKRTRFQQEYKAQLMMEVSRAATTEEGALPFYGLSNPEYSTPLPQIVALEDDTVLPQIELKDGESIKTVQLSPLEQAVALAVLVNHKGSLARELLTDEEISSYLEMIIPQVSSWSVAVATLALRCKMEKGSRRRVERSMQQLEDLIKQSQKPSEAGPADRLKLFYAAWPLPVWEMQRELAAILISLGCIGAALDIYEKLELWEDAIVCYQRLGKQSKAESVIREQLAIKETPSLLCFLGDVTQNKDHYEKAWEMSNHRSARAMRCLAYIHFREEKFEEAVECFEKSLAINYLQIPVWFTCGCASLAAENYEAAAKAFKSCVNIDYDNFEAWNNLATAYARLKKKRKAYLALKDAIRCCFDNWRLWDNYLVMATDCGEFEEAIRAYHKLLDIKQKWTDTEVLRVIVKAVVSDLEDGEGRPSRRLLPKILELFARIKSKTTLDAEMWKLKADLCLLDTPEHPADPKEAMNCLKSSYRCLTQENNWDRLPENCEKVAQQSLKLSEMYQWCADQMDKPDETIGLIYQAKLMLNGIVTRIRQKHTDPATKELTEPLNSTCQTLDEELESVVKKLAELRSTQ